MYTSKFAIRTQPNLRQAMNEEGKKSILESHIRAYQKSYGFVDVCCFKFEPGELLELHINHDQAHVL